MLNSTVRKATTRPGKDKVPPAKRARLALAEDQPSVDDQNDRRTLPSRLPPDVWARVMAYMPFRDVLNCTVVSKLFLKDVAPRVKRITILDKREMRLVLARRFPNVEDVIIGCLYRYPKITERSYMYDNEENYEFDYFEDFLGVFDTIDSVAISLVAPFLSAFSSLKNANIGGLFIEETLFVAHYHRDFGIDDHEFNVLLESLEMAIGGAYASGALPPDAKIWGVDAPCYGDSGGNDESSEGGDDEACTKCQRYCECFPIRKIVQNLNQYCMSPKTCLEMLLKRRGGKEYFISHEFILLLCHEPTFRGKVAEDIVTFLKEQDLLPQISRHIFLEWLGRKDRNGEVSRIQWALRHLHRFDFLVSLGIPVHKNDIPSADVDEFDDSA